MKLDALLILKRFAVILAVAALALVTIGCGEDGAGEGPTPSPSPTPQAEVPDFPRLEGVTTAEEYGPFGDAGLQRWQRDVPGIEDVRIPSTMDDHDQPALWLPPNGDGPQPLLVVVHSWSTDYLQHLGIPFAEWAEASGWGMINPDFRGVNDNPDATGSDLAVQDVIDAIDFAAEEAEIDEDRVYIVGFSGGGMMSLLMAGRHPDRFAGAVAWVPIHDLTAWYEYNVDEQPDAHYPGHIRSSCGGDPTTDDAAREECEQRSPVAHLDAAREAGVPVYVGHGLSDPIVPPVHSLWSFDQLVGEGHSLDDELVEAVAQNRLPDELDGSVEAETYFSGDDPDVFFSRQVGEVTLVLFEGEHDMVYNPGLEWMWGLAYGDGADGE
jgi:predicted esterase